MWRALHTSLTVRAMMVRMATWGCATHHVPNRVRAMQLRLHFSASRKEEMPFTVLIDSRTTEVAWKGVFGRVVRCWTSIFHPNWLCVTYTHSCALI